MNKEEVKKELYDQCKEWIAKRRSKVEHIIADIRVSLEDETKSSAGDKHETGRAMLQIKREQTGEQLKEVGKTEKSLSKVDINIQSDTIRLGSVAHTSTHNFFIAISAGELKTDEGTFYAIGIASPMGQLLLGQKEGDVVRFRESEIKIITVY